MPCFAPVSTITEIVRNGSRVFLITLRGNELQKRQFGDVCLRHLFFQRVLWREYGCCALFKQRRDVFVIQIQHVWQAVAVFRIPAGVVAGVHDAFAALRLLTLALGGDNESLIIEKQQDVTPFLEQRSNLLRELHLPAVVCTHLVRQLEFPHLGVSGHNHMYPSGYHLIESGEQS